jgi:hypothetical protein
MDITPQDNTTQSISDDQELAKALAGVLPEEPEVKPAGMQFEETPAATPAAVAAVAPIAPISVPTPVVPEATASENLEDIKLDALKELRPLIDKVDLPAEEKFDTYLMLLRSTDDSTLIAPAHTAAQNIVDEKRKAEALLEIIKEIDYLSRKDQPAA